VPAHIQMDNEWLMRFEGVANSVNDTSEIKDTNINMAFIQKLTIIVGMNGCGKCVPLELLLLFTCGNACDKILLCFKQTKLDIYFVLRVI